METIDQSIDVNADIRAVYNQWTQFEDFPEFMEGVQEVRQLDDRRLHWVAKVAGHRHEWDAEIYDQIPDQRIAWRSLSGTRSDGLVRFEKISDNETRVRVQFSYEPEGAMEKLGDSLGVLSARVKGDLKRFKEFIEKRGRETGAWRGEIHGHSVQHETETEARSKRLRAEPHIKSETP